MSDRTISAISASMTYGVVTALCLAVVLLGLAPHPFLHVLAYKLPIIVQLQVADVAGLAPLLAGLERTQHWTVFYAVLVFPMACLFYCVGWWIEVLDEQTRDVVLAPRPAVKPSGRQSGRDPRRQRAQLVWVRLLCRVRPERRGLRARDNVEVHVRHGLAGRAAVELGDQDARRLQRGLDRRRHLLGGADAGRGAVAR